MLHVQHAGPAAFDQEQLRILKAFAERAAAALENRLLYAEVRRYTGQLEQRVHERTTDLSVRNAVAETLSSSLDMIEMLDGVLQTTVQQLGVLGGAIYLLSADGASLELAAHCGVSETVLELVTGIQPGGETVRPEILPDLIGRTGISAVLSVPIWRQEQVQGVISLVHDQPHPWSAEESRMLDAIGRQIGVALANARLYAEAVRGEAHIRAILSNVADGLLVFDHDDCPVLINPAAERLLEFFPAQSGGPLVAAARLWSWLRVRTQNADAAEHLEFNLPAEALVADTELLHEQCVSQGCPAALRRDLGWPCWLRESELRDEEMALCAVVQRVPKRAVQACSTPIYDADGTVLGTVIALHDVTYYRQLDELKDRFVSTVSHELRTPLSTVLLQISTLNKYYNRLGEDERREMMGDIEQQAYVLRELIEDILELSRFDARRAMPQMQWFDLAELCRASVTSLRAVIQNKDLQIDLAGCTHTCYLNGDQNQLARAFHNLFSNAIKYTPAGGQIIVGLEQVGPEVRLSIEDTGIGIAPEDQRYIFDRFFRADDASRQASGTGLGLAITKEIIDLHQGRIELRSWPGQGSTFTMILPVGAPEQPES